MMVSCAQISKLRSSPGWHILGAVLVLAWVISIFIMIGGETLDEREEELQITAELFNSLMPEDQWMGVYLRDFKLGYLHTRVVPKSFGVDLEQKIHLVIQLIGEQKELNGSVKVRLSRSSLLESFNVFLDSVFLRVRMQGNVEGNVLVVEVEIGDKRYKQRLSLEESPVVSLVLPKMLAKHNLQGSRSYRVRMFDPLTLSNQSMLIEVVGIKAVPSEHGLVPAFHIRRTLIGQPVESWIDGRGGLLREEYPAMGLMLRREEQSVATNLPKGLKPYKDQQDAMTILHTLLKGKHESDP